MSPKSACGADDGQRRAVRPKLLGHGRWAGLVQSISKPRELLPGQGTRDLKIFIYALLLSLLLSITGCLLGPIAGARLDSEQMKALKEYNDNGDMYLCAIVEGGTRNGNITMVLVPKGAPVEVQFSSDCHAAVKTTGGGTYKGL